MLVPPLSFLTSIITSMVPSSDLQAYNLEVVFNQYLYPSYLLRNIISSPFRMLNLYIHSPLILIKSLLDYLKSLLISNSSTLRFLKQGSADYSP